MSVFTTYVEKRAEEKKKKPSEWLSARLDDIPVCTFATHVGKFSNPDVNCLLLDLSAGTKGGTQVSSYNTDIPIDISVNSSANLGTAYLLLLELEDGRPMWEHLATGEESLLKEIRSFGCNDHQAMADLCDVLERKMPTDTDRRLAQVFFPVNTQKTQDHLLTVLPPSSLLIEEKRRIRARRQGKFDKKIPSFQEFPHLTGILYGGSNPQNISTLNSKERGRGYLLSSLPPNLSKGYIHLPVRDFFRECILYYAFRRNFYAFHGLLKRKQNNKELRDRRDDILSNMLDVISLSIYRLWSVEPGWSLEAYRLPTSQKILLDEYYKKQRRDDDSWLYSISREITDFILYTYGQIFKDALKLELGEHHYIRTFAYHYIADLVEGRE